MINTVKELNIIIVGVGGQGVVLISDILGRAAVREGINVVGSEVLGMAQRGGSVFSNIRFGSNVYAPLTPDGRCDILVTLEPSEALRNIQYLNKSSIVIMNNHEVIPSSVSLGLSTYPKIKQITDKLNTLVGRVIIFNAVELAEKAGNSLSANMVMLGALFGSGQIPIKIETVKTIIKESFPAKAATVNEKAFESGFQVFGVRS
jgi:indolepyruvate ferredoxin oxidoreductase beta subunit